MGLNDLRNVKIDTLIGCKLTAQEALVFLEDLQNILASHHLPQDLPQLWRILSKHLLRPNHPFELHQLLFKTTYLGWDTTTNGPAPVWIPTQQGAASTNAARFMHLLKLKCPPSVWNTQAPSGDIRSDWPLLHHLSINHPEIFWPLVLEEFHFKFHRPPTQILKHSTPDGDPDAVEWLPGARFNIAECALTAHDPDRPAILWAEEDAPATIHTITRGELAQQAQHIADALHAWGLKPGDAVGLDMPMVPEAVAAYLGIILAGCVAVSIADSFAAKEIESRLRIAKAKAIITQDVVLRGGKVLPLYARVTEAGAPKAVVLPAGGSAGGGSRSGGGEKKKKTIRGELRSGDLSWDAFLSLVSTVPIALNPYIHPGNDSNTTLSGILFSSGTTGEPKAIPWTHVTPIRCAADAYFHQDVRIEDVVCWPSSMGWMMGSWLVMSCLFNGAAMALFTGSPLERQFGQFVSSARVSVLGIVPSIVRSWKSSGCMRGIDWSCIRCFSSTGEASAADEYLWLSSLAGYSPVIEYCGGTEIGGGFLSGSMVQPQAPATFSTPTIGSRPVVIILVGENTKEVLLEPGNTSLKTSVTGELALVMPQLGVSQSLLNANHKQVYFEGMPRPTLRRHGDEIEALPGGYCRAHGRVDDTMNLGGIKVSSVELERAVVEGVEEIAEAAAVAVPPADGGPDNLVLFLVLRKEIVDGGDASSVKLLRACQHAISSRLNPLFKIGAVHVIAALPRNASNKVMRRVLRDGLVVVEKKSEFKGTVTKSRL